MRGQVELPAVAVALLALTGTAVLGVAVADGAFRSAERPALEQGTAAGLSDQLVSESAPVTVRQNVLDTAGLDSIDEELLHRHGLPADSDATVRLDGETLVSTGDTTGGTRVERIVVLEERTERTLVPTFDASTTVTLPRRTANATVTIPPSANIETVDVNGRVVLHDERGLTGAYDVAVPRFETASLGFRAEDEIGEGVTVSYYPAETRKAILTVIIDA